MKIIKSLTCPLTVKSVSAMLLCLAATTSYVHGMENDESFRKKIAPQEKISDANKILKANISRILKDIPLDAEHISKPISVSYLKRLKNEDINYESLYTLQNNLDKKYDATNALALAVGSGDVERLETFLKVIPDINAEMFYAWGYRQPYNPAHLALNPVFLFCANISVKTRLKVIDMLGEKGVDFNRCPKGGSYSNPPLGNELMGNKGGMDNLSQVRALQSRAFLWGADPRLNGTSITCLPYAYRKVTEGRGMGNGYSWEKGDEEEISRLYAPIYKQALNFWEKEKDKRKDFKLTDYVKTVFKRIYIEKFQSVCQKKGYSFEGEKEQKFLKKQLEPFSLKQ